MTTTLPAPLQTARRPARKAAAVIVEPPAPDVVAPPTTTPYVLGGDLSITATGLAWPDGVVKTHGKDGLTGAGMSLFSKAAALDGLASELYYMTTGRTGINEINLIMVEMLPTTGTRVHSELCYLWWQFVRLCTRHGLVVVEVPPTCLKLYVTGMGDANKREVLRAVQALLPQFDIRKTSKRTRDPLSSLDDNKADAAVLCAMGMDLLGHPLAKVPARNRAALDKLQLPEGLRH